MRRRTFLGALMAICVPQHSIAEDTYLDAAVFLDAEELAEAGVKDAYVNLLPQLRKFVVQPNTVDEELGPNAEFYKVRAGGNTYLIYDQSSDDLFQMWARATTVLFEIVNEQLTATNYRLLALYGGNDLQGVFLSTDEAERIRSRVAGRAEWPYQPTMTAPWYGQYHDDGAAKPWYQTVPQ